MKAILIVVLFASSACAGSTSPTDAGYDGEASLNEVLGTPSRSELRQRVENVQRKVQQDIADCMLAKGFDYIAWVDPASLPPAPAPEIEGLSNAEIAEQFGWGISTLPASQPEIIPNPNEAIRASLTDQELEAYNTALRGPLQQSSDDELPFYEVSTATRGADNCEQSAFDASLPSETAPQAKLEEFYALFDDLQTRIEQHPDVATAYAEIEGCMTASGIATTEGVADPIQHFLAEATAITGLEDNSYESLENAKAIGTLSPTDLQQVRNLERTLATTEVDCTSDYEAVYTSTQQTLEQDFLDENYLLVLEVRDSI